jgi:membrane protease YdiL (CAAX protease family)
LPEERPRRRLLVTEVSGGERRGEPVLITTFYGLLIVLASVVTAVAGLMVVRRLIPLPIRKRNNTATGTIYAALYVMFGVSVGFSLFLTWQQYNTARQVAKNEAVAVEQIYRLADRLPQPNRSRVQDLAVSYARGVEEKEWSSMRQGQESPRAKTHLEDLRRSVQDFQPRTDAQSDLYSASLTELDELEANRELRLLAVNEGIPYIVWVVLVAGGVLTVAFTYLFGIEPAWLHAVAVAGLAMLVSLVLHVIGVLDYPFNGGLQVQPDAFEQVLREIRGNNQP